MWPVLTWFAHEASQLHLNIPLLLLQVLLLHPGRNDRSDCPATAQVGSFS